MAGNFGIGLGSFLTGFSQGAQTMQSIKANNSKQRLYDLELKNAENAAAANDQARSIATQGAQDAQSNTDGGVDNMMNYYANNVVPKLQQHWMAQGDIQKADAFGKWTQDRNVQQGMRYGAALIRDAQMGNPEGVMNNMVKLYNQPGYFEDGMSAVDAKLTRDDKGNASGMEIQLKNDKTGEISTHKFSTMDEVYKTALQFGQPDQVFKMGMDQLAAGQKAQAEIAKEQRGLGIDNAKAERDLNNDLTKQNNQSQLRQAEETAKNGAGKSNPQTQAINAKIAALKAAGWSDEKINSRMEQIVGVDNKSRPITSRMDDAIKLKSETDRAFAKLPLKEQQVIVLEALQNQDRLTAEKPESTPGMTTTGQQNNQQQQQAVPYFDTKTGQIVTRPY